LWYDQADDKICKTDTCKSSEDCLSGACKDGICVSIDYEIILCKGQKKDNKMTFLCGKQAQMQCKNDSDCYSNHCVKGYCENQSSNIREFLLSTTKWKTVAIVFIIIAAFILCCCCGTGGSRQ